MWTKAVSEGQSLGRTVIVLMKIKQGEVCETRAKKVIAEGRESLAGG